MADKDILKDARECFALAHDAESENREWALDDLEFARLGDQWPADVRRQREAEGRPCLTINRIPAFARQIVNDARQNKPAIKVRPADSNADPKTADIYNGLIRNIEQTSNAEVAYDTALESAVYGGFGYFRIKTEYAHDDTFDLDIVIERIANPFTVYGDPQSQACDASDWRFGFVTELVPVKDFKARFGKDVEAVDWSADGDDKGELWREEDSVRVAEYWKREPNKRVIVALSNGQVIDAQQYQANREIWDASGIVVVGERETMSHKVVHYLLTGSDVLETNAWPGRYIPIVPVYGDEINIEGKRYFKSLVRDMRDPQMMFNFWRTASTELVALAPKAPFIGPRGAFDTDMGKWQTAHVKSHPFIEYDGPVPPQRQAFAGVPAGALQEALNASDDMKSVSGIYDASLGARSNETSGRAIMARQREGDVGNFHYIDNLSRGIRYAGRVLLDLIPAVYDKPRMIRVLGEDGTPKTVQVNAPDAHGNIYELARGKYDLIVETGPSYTSKRDEAVAMLTEVMRASPAATPLLMDVMARNMDFPEADKIAARFKAMLPPPIQALEQQDDGQGATPEVLMQQLAQAQQQIAQMQQALQQVEVQRAQVEAQKVQIDAQKAQSNAQLEAQRLALERENEAKRLELEKYRADLDAQVRLYIEQLKAGVQEQSQVRQIEYDASKVAAEQSRVVEGDAKVDALAAATQEIMANLQAMAAAVDERLTSVSQTLTAPRKVIRENGRIVGVEVNGVMRPVERDANGQVTGIQ